MKQKIYRLLISSSILSLPGIFSIVLSLISIPVHLNIAGVVNYGNYIIFHFLLIISSVLNFGIGKSIAVSINNYPKKNKEISFQGIRYTFFVIIITLSFLIIFLKFNQLSFISKLISAKLASYVLFGIVLSILYASLEGIFQGNRMFKFLSFFNFMFFSLALSLPSLILLIYGDLSLKDLIIFSLIIKTLSILFMVLFILTKNLMIKSNNQILFLNLKKNARWLTLNSILVHFYDLFDKYLVKIFLGPIAIAIYSIPQQLTGKLSIISKGFSAYLLTNLSSKNQDNDIFNYSLKIFLQVIPILIFFLFPLYEFFLNFWLSDQYNQKILLLTKIFSLCAIFSCTSHILITKFEASKTLKRNLKIEFLLMPFFLMSLYFLTSNKFSIIEVSFLILLKEVILLFFRLNLLKKIIKNLFIHYFYILIFLITLYFSINFENLFYIILILLILSIFIRND
tara:strand:- start:2386 stop:3747 length:1362 start_codon:yes stop_codon:yes gene_type:complete